MPVSIPLTERMAELSIHSSQQGLALYKVKLNWKSLQVIFRCGLQTRIMADRCCLLPGRTNGRLRHHDRSDV